MLNCFSVVIPELGIGIQQWIRCKACIIMGNSTNEKIDDDD